MDRERVTERYMETRGCRVKKPYASKKIAKMAVRSLKKHAGSFGIRPYRCVYCKLFHVGHYRKVVGIKKDS